MGNLRHIPTYSAPGVDGIDVSKAKETFANWIDTVLRSAHNRGYKAPPVKRIRIPKPGKTEKRPIGVSAMPL